MSLFDIACVIEDIANLDGFDIQFYWDPTYLAYITHTPTFPVEDYPSPIPPSPYAGILHAPKLALKDEVNDTAGTYWVAGATLGGPSFTGSGTAFVMTFATQNIPYGNPADFFDTILNFTSVDLASGTTSVPHSREHGVVRMHYVPVGYPGIPLLKVMPELIECESLGGNVTAEVMLMGINEGTGEIVDLPGFWDVAGIDAYLNFDPTMIGAINVEIDPNGWFAGFFSLGILEITIKINNVVGYVHVSFVGYGSHPAPVSGTDVLFTVTFTALTETDTYLPACSELILENPESCFGQFFFHSNGGLIDLGSSVGTTWTDVVTLDNVELMTLEDLDTNGELSIGDKIQLENTVTGFYFKYRVEDIKGNPHTPTNASQGKR